MPIRFVGANSRAGRAIARAGRRLARRGVQAMRRRAPRKMSTFAKRVMAVVNRTEETKYVANAHDANGNPLTPLFNPTPNIDVVGKFYPALPRLGQGTDDYQRIGNKIAPKSLAVSLKVSMNAVDLSANAIMVAIYYGTSRTEKTWQAANPLPTAAILDDGDGTNSVFAGDRFDLTKPLDRKLVNARRIVFRLSKTAGLQNWDAVPGQPQGNNSTSNGISEKNVLLKFRVPKSLVYQQATASYPSNYAPWYAIGFCHTDGSPIDLAADAELVSVTPQVHMYFKDA